MAKFITSEPFAALASKLSKVNVDTIISSSLAEAGDEYVQVLRQLHQHQGADDALVAAIKSFKDGPLGQGAGVQDGTPQAEAAFAFEFGSEDHSAHPHGIFRTEAPGMAKHAEGNIAAEIARRVAT